VPYQYRTQQNTDFSIKPLETTVSPKKDRQFLTFQESADFFNTAENFENPGAAAEPKNPGSRDLTLDRNSVSPDSVKKTSPRLDLGRAALKNRPRLDLGRASLIQKPKPPRNQPPYSRENPEPLEPEFVQPEFIYNPNPEPNVAEITKGMSTLFAGNSDNYSELQDLADQSSDETEKKSDEELSEDEIVHNWNDGEI